MSAAAIEADLDVLDFAPGQFELEWPPRSGQIRRFPEIDQLKYFALNDAIQRILASQIPLIHEALQLTTWERSPSQRVVNVHQTPKFDSPAPEAEPHRRRRAASEARLESRHRQALRRGHDTGTGRARAP